MLPFWPLFLAVIRRPHRALEALYWYATRRRVRARNRWRLIAGGSVETFRARKANKFLEKANFSAVGKLADILPRDRRINVLYWADGNFFMTGIAKYVHFILQEQGYDAGIGTETPVRDGSFNLVVAPHEFCAHGPGRTWSQQQYAEAAYVNTEQWHTTWFALGLSYIKKSSVGVIDVNPSSAAGFARRGMKSAFLPLLPVPGSCFDIPSQPLSRAVSRYKYVRPLTYAPSPLGRTYDVAYVAVSNDRRAKAMAMLSPVLAEYDCFIHSPRFDRPLKPGDPDVLDASDVAQIARNSKILLNIHQGESHYLEWQRVFLAGMMEGCIVVSEPCIHNPYVRPGEHYIECSLDDMPSVICRLLSTPEGHGKIEEIHARNTKLRESIMDGERFLAQ